MATSRRGQQYGTVGVEEGIALQAWMDRDQYEAFRSLCKKEGVTMSLSVNQFVSAKLIAAGKKDRSRSLELRGA